MTVARQADPDGHRRCLVLVTAALLLVSPGLSAQEEDDAQAPPGELSATLQRSIGLPEDRSPHSMDALLDAAESSFDSRDPELQGELARALGQLLSTGNRFEEALSWFDRALAVVEGAARSRVLLEKAEVLIQLGRGAEARELARQSRDGAADRDLRVRSIAVVARAYAAEGDARAADDILRGIEVVSDRRELSPQTLHQMYRVARDLGNERRARRISEQLRQQYPESPEALLLAEGRVREALSPSGIAAGGFTVPAATDTNDLPQESGDGPDEDGSSDAAVFIQVGSFQDPENAEYMEQDMEELGFESLVRSRELGERSYYQVLIPVVVEEGEDRQSAVQDLVVALKERGYEGFLVSE